MLSAHIASSTIDNPSQSYRVFVALEALHASCESVLMRPSHGWAEHPVKSNAGSMGPFWIQMRTSQSIASWSSHCPFLLIRCSFHQCHAIYYNISFHIIVQVDNNSQPTHIH